MDDPTELTPENVAEVGRKYGINLLKDKLDGIKAIYGQFLQSTIPPGKGQLDGTEASRVRAFKESLSLTDEDAAEVHIEVGRRLMRDGFETKSRYAQEEQRRTFYRLIYVSALVFGDAKAAFLLPWKRVFELNDAQMFVARRDNAKVIFRAFLDAQCGGELTADGEVLSLLRAKSVEVKLMDESATEMAKETSRR